MTIDLDAIKRRHLDPEKTAGRTMYEGHITIDLAALVAEVERLRAEVKQERAAVVAWLRVERDYMRAHNLTGGSAHMQGLIAEIESGEHRREEAP